MGKRRKMIRSNPITRTRIQHVKVYTTFGVMNPVTPEV